MRSLVTSLIGLTMLSSLGCSSSTSPLANASPQPGAAASELFGAIALQGSVSEAALAVYTLNIEPDTLQATSQLRASRAGQANDDLYLLSIDNFLNAKSFRIVGVSATATTLDVDYTVTHPFPAPNNPAGTPNGSTNRADLGIAGRVLVLADVPSATGNTFFSDRIANTALLANADAYYAPAGLLNLALTANTFPYKSLVDESGSDGTRVGISNGGDPTGNFGADGWTRAEFGAANDAWTGFGLLHQGQVSRNTLSLAKSELSSGLSLDVAIIAKYNDPRMGINSAAKRANRLPPASADASLFAYRMPHGALDVADIEFVGESGGFSPNAISSSTLSFRVVDWDARATETTAADLSEDLDVTTVAVGESGTPTISVCIPGVLGDSTFIDVFDPTDLLDDDSAFGGDAGQDLGRPGDALFYSRTVTKAAGAGQVSGDYVGLMRAEDVEFAAPLPIALDGTTLAPLAANLPSPATYQAFSVQLGTPNTLPTGNWTLNAPTIFDGGTTSVTVAGVVDPDSATFDVQVDWGAGGGFVTVASGLAVGAGPFGPYASPVYTLANPLVQETKTLAVRLVDGVSASTNLATNIGGDVLTINPAPSGSCPGFASATGTPVSGGWTGLTTLTTISGCRAGTLWGTADFATFPAGSAYANQYVYFDTRSITGGYDYLAFREVTTASDCTTRQSLFATPKSGQGNQIEIDSTGRIIFSDKPGPDDNHQVSSNYIEDIALPNFYWFDYTGTPAASYNTVNTPSGIVAMTLDEADNVYVIGLDHILRRYMKASSYAQDTSAPYPINLNAFGLTALGTTAGPNNHNVADFVIDFTSKAFFIATGIRTTPNNCGLWRIECDGTYSTVIAGNPNPYLCANGTSATQQHSLDLNIDQKNAAGALTPQGQHQLIFSIDGNSTLAGYPEVRFINTNLSNYANWDPYVTPTTTNYGSLAFLTILPNNTLVSKDSNDYTNHGRTTTPPTNWQ